jgi:uncharacterized protein YutE (UPF0331/DUF86 family)
MAPDVRARLENLRRNVARLEAARERAVDEALFQSDADLVDIVERNFHLAIEALIDLAAHAAASRGLTRPETSAALFESLAEAGALPSEQASAARQWVGFRNILVHQYAEIDRAIVFRTLQRELTALKTLASAVAAAILNDGDEYEPD